MAPKHASTASVKLEAYRDLSLSPLPSPNLRARNFHTRPRSRTAVLAPLTLWISYNVFYKLSLVPAYSPAQMNSWLPYIGTVMVLAVLSLTSLLWSAFWQPPALHRFVLILIPANVGAWILIDSGNRLEQHGAFNMLIFAVIITPLNLVMLTFYNWWRLAAGGRRGSNRRDQERAKHGFFGVRIDDDAEAFKDDGGGLCEWKPTTAWMQLLPFRQNFFVGPLTCKADDSFSARFDGDKLVIDDCEATSTPIKSYIDDSLLQTLDGAGYSILPATREWGLPVKADSLKAPTNDFQMHVLDYVYNHTYAYTEPVTIDAGIDTVIARCGNVEPKLVYRITDVEAKSDIPAPESNLNIVTLFIDSVSRPMLHRRLPKTISALETLSHRPSLGQNTSTSSPTSSLYEFFRFHTVGINTGPNTRALWAGLPDDTTSGPPLWQQLRSAGYTTARVDSMCQDWDAYYNPGNTRNSTPAPPTLDHEFIAYSCLPPYLPPSKKLAGNFWGPTSIVPRCLSGEHQSTHALNYAEEFIRKYKGSERPFYINAGFMDSHEGSGEMLRAMDDRLSAFLNPATSPIDYSNTAVLILSDHGALMGLNYVFFENGKVERAEPFAALVLPDSYVAEEGRAERLVGARMKLVTAFDFYEMTRGLAGVRREEGGRGVDFVGGELPVRGCAEAGIPEADCQCV
ncbi:MAG: hypothetical protein MMC23_007478 [Stictis urceolatum]|nr:hypothetical protein [Stictis urceolata]